ncbi:hypothetical protein NOR_00945 [Metarhizium rileyi]|uniref:SnoaL-like domain-containing protein n=1 Tax=Metarhizium rileyi (strain RCEF 4871) TaxID=1649241 RepID=A0A162I010_METRR|nr:hypothetical protein NOR_00945 [Metarhizium rileyi RCEF 4871]
MAHTYRAICPDGIDISPDMIEFLGDFYRISDIPGEHDQYVDLFMPSATFILASKRASGKEGSRLQPASPAQTAMANSQPEIMNTRIGMWSAVASRRHTVHKVFPSSNSSNEFMLYGSVALGLRSGANIDVDWAARADIVKAADGKWRMKFYQVYLDTGAITAAANQ